MSWNASEFHGSVRSICRGMSHERVTCLIKRLRPCFHVPPLAPRLSSVGGLCPSLAFVTCPSCWGCPGS